MPTENNHVRMRGCESCTSCDTNVTTSPRLCCDEDAHKEMQGQRLTLPQHMPSHVKHGAGRDTIVVNDIALRARDVRKTTEVSSEQGVRVKRRQQ